MMEVIKHGDKIYDVKFHQTCWNCGADILYNVNDQVSLPEEDGIFCPECIVFLNHEDSERILTWLNPNGELNEDKGETRLR